MQSIYQAISYVVNQELNNYLHRHINDTNNSLTFRWYENSWVVIPQLPGVPGIGVEQRPRRKLFRTGPLGSNQRRGS